ncbi:MAG TPA: hypothetical protein VET88_09485 [Gammaproteobacteria bacterium]|nr:hypothetical protein [Gammaproteobacteria bacterium]
MKLFAFLLSVFVCLLLSPVSRAGTSELEEYIQVIQPAVDALITAAGGKPVDLPLSWQARDEDRGSSLVPYGEKLLVAIEGTESQYSGLKHEDWIQASEYLLGIDDLIAQRAGLGNAIIKGKIIEMILAETQRRLTMRRMNTAELKQTRQLLQDMQYHLPDRLTVYQYVYSELVQQDIMNRSLNANADSMKDTDLKWRTAVDKKAQMILGDQFEPMSQKQYEEGAKSILKASSVVDMYSVRPLAFLVHGLCYQSMKRWRLLRAYADLLIARGSDFSDWKRLEQDEKWYYQAIGLDDWGGYFFSYAYPERSPMEAKRLARALQHLEAREYKTYKKGIEKMGLPPIRWVAPVV